MIDTQELTEIMKFIINDTGNTSESRAKAAFFLQSQALRKTDAQELLVKAENIIKLATNDYKCGVQYEIIEAFVKQSKQLTHTQQALDIAKAAISKMRILADEARGFITARLANKPRANICLLKIQQMSIFPEKEKAEMQKTAEEFVTELVASIQLDIAVEALNKIYAGGDNYSNTIWQNQDLKEIAKAALSTIKDKEGICFI